MDLGNDWKFNKGDMHPSKPTFDKPALGKGRLLASDFYDKMRMLMGKKSNLYLYGGPNLDILLVNAQCTGNVNTTWTDFGSIFF